MSFENAGGENLLTRYAVNDFEKSSYLAGSVVDMSRPPSPVDL